MAAWQQGRAAAARDGDCLEKVSPTGTTGTLRRGLHQVSPWTRHGNLRRVKDPADGRSGARLEFALTDSQCTNIGQMDSVPSISVSLIEPAFGPFHWSSVAQTGCLIAVLPCACGARVLSRSHRRAKSAPAREDVLASKWILTFAGELTSKSERSRLLYDGRVLCALSRWVARAREFRHKATGEKPH